METHKENEPYGAKITRFPDAVHIFAWIPKILFPSISVIISFANNSNIPSLFFCCHIFSIINLIPTPFLSFIRWIYVFPIFIDGMLFTITPFLIWTICIPNSFSFKPNPIKYFIIISATFCNKMKSNLIDYTNKKNSTIVHSILLNRVMLFPSIIFIILFNKIFQWMYSFILQLVSTIIYIYTWINSI